jgi:hypothetical protein
MPYLNRGPDGITQTAPWVRRSVRMHQVSLDGVRDAKGAAHFALAKEYWFVHHDQALAFGVQDPRWIPQGMERLYVQGDARFETGAIPNRARQLGATRVFRIKDWIVWVFPHTSDARRALPALSEAVHTVDNEQGNCLVTLFGGG